MIWGMLKYLKILCKIPSLKKKSVFRSKSSGRLILRHTPIECFTPVFLISGIIITSWWFQPKLAHFPQVGVKYKQVLKPPPSKSSNWNFAIQKSHENLLAFWLSEAHKWA